MLDAFETPLTILLWIAVVVVTTPFVIMIAGVLWLLISNERDRWGYRRADKGKARCEAYKDDGKRCNNLATHRTPKGVYCDYDSRQRENNTTYRSMSSYSFRLPLHFTKEGTK